MHVTRHQVTPCHALISKFFDLLLLDCGRPECLLVPPVDVIVSSTPASLLPVVTILVVTIVVSVSPVLVLVIIVASSVATVMEIVVVESLLLLLIAVVLIVVLVVLQVMLKTLLKLLLICQTRRITELLLLLLLMHLSRLLLLLLLTLLLLLVYLLLLSLLSVSHAGVVEVVHGRVDVTHVTPIHGHGLRLVMHRRPRSSKHHLSLEISQRLHARHCGRREGGSVASLLLLLELWRRLLTHELRLLMLVTRPRH